MNYSIAKTRIGEILLVASDEGLKRVEFLSEENLLTIPDAWKRDDEKLYPIAFQLDAYFNNELQTFNVKLSPDGTEFQKRVWNELLKIPYGATSTYSQIAEALGDKKTVRAVGMANAKNPIMIIIPCHRVIGKDKQLTGYAGGLKLKRQLLEIEGTYLGYIAEFL